MCSPPSLEQVYLPDLRHSGGMEAGGKIKVERNASESAVMNRRSAREAITVEALL